jgi:hypothetical protein
MDSHGIETSGHLADSQCFVEMFRSALSLLISPSKPRLHNANAEDTAPGEFD